MTADQLDALREKTEVLLRSIRSHREVLAELNATLIDLRAGLRTLGLTRQP